MYLARVSGRKGQANSYGEGKRGRGGNHDGFQGTRRTLCVPSAGAEMAGEAEAGASLHNRPGSQQGPWRFVCPSRHTGNGQGVAFRLSVEL